ncbi:hypothetical protein BT69DRAFT_118526 [Atractiella rhizophila]|nr:hypothetical protein BT69DRAFT_118526 [Atractiella rhizophila]
MPQEDFLAFAKGAYERVLEFVEALQGGMTPLWKRKKRTGTSPQSPPSRVRAWTLPNH